MPTPDQIDQIVSVLEEIVARYGIDDAYLVGGFPRAIAMRRGADDIHDIDVATGTPEKAVLISGLLLSAGATKYQRRNRTGTVTLEMNGVEMDFQGPASHDDTRPWLHMYGVEPTPLAMNIFDRDFTINSLAIPIGSWKIIDLTSRGMSDIEDNRISSILPADFSVPKNPLMITRAIKFAYKYDFKIDGDLWDAMKENSDKLFTDLTPERLAIEAFVLSKYDCGDMLEELGLEKLRDPQFVDTGKGIASA